MSSPAPSPGRSDPIISAVRILALCHTIAVCALVPELTGSLGAVLDVSTVFPLLFLGLVLMAGLGMATYFTRDDAAMLVNAVALGLLSVAVVVLLDLPAGSWIPSAATIGLGIIGLRRVVRE